MLVVKPKLGLSDLHFGAAMEDAIKHFGEPEETEEMDTAGEYPSTVMHYWAKGFSLFFDHAQSKKFTCAEIDHKDTLLWEVRVFDLSEKQLLELFRIKGFNQSDSEKHEWGEHRISFDEALIDFYFEKGKLTSINFSIPPDGITEKVLILPN